ncbi:YibE/F family protein [Peterkaempfera bronchialis]|uniref:YibE/F family protein n=1 Tax=Peterkaempfera bronchialis TaxID=2126346 RepID=A0A345SY69_9ACTN|nr:YibE/F family protein [Peterkaempfera bronchialis]AXI78674.1 YibE/F family protein [Peterkaempfera bronchialis]
MAAGHDQQQPGDGDDPALAHSHATSPSHGHGHGHGHSHAHHHGPAAPASARLRRVIAAVLVPFAVAVVAGLVVLWPGGVPPHSGGASGIGFDQKTVHGTVVATAQAPCQGDAGTAVCTKVSVRLTSGPEAGRTVRQTLNPDGTGRWSAGDKVILTDSPGAPPELRYAIADADRAVPMAALAAVFALAVVAVGRLRGLTALVALVVSFAILTLFILPAVLHGQNPLLVAVVGGSAIMLVALYLCHGLSARTSVAVIGTLSSLALIGVLGEVFIGLTKLTGNTSDETALVHSLYPGIRLDGVLLAGVIIGSLGVLDDVTVTQTSAVWELRAANPGLGARQLYRAGIRIGRDHIASTVNTLVMAYAGAALPLLLLFSISQRDVGSVATSEIVAEEIVRTLVGSIGLVASVPVTTALAALVASRDRVGPVGRSRRARGGLPTPAAVPAPATAAPDGAPTGTPTGTPTGPVGHRRR